MQGAEEQYVELAGVDVGMELMELDEDEGQLGWMNLTRLLGYKTIENRFRNNPQFRNYDSETIWTDSETICTDPETRNYLGQFRNYLHRFKKLRRFRNCDQKLFCPIQKLRFRNYFARFRNHDSETFSPDSETTIQNLFRPIQKLFRTLYLALQEELHDRGKAM